jgi:hypothetical protein
VRDEVDSRAPCGDRGVQPCRRDRDHGSFNFTFNGQHASSR